MKKITYSEEPHYVWECSECGQFNEEPEEPTIDENVICENCSEEFEVDDER